jgi:hypothetical protein
MSNPMLTKTKMFKRTPILKGEKFRKHQFFSFADKVQRSVTKKYCTCYCTFEPLHHETNIRGGGETVPVVFKYLPGTGILRDGVYAKKVPFQPKKSHLYGPYEVTAEPPFHIGPLHMISLLQIPLRMSSFHQG